MQFFLVHVFDQNILHCITVCTDGVFAFENIFLDKPEYVYMYIVYICIYLYSLAIVCMYLAHTKLYVTNKTSGLGGALKIYVILCNITKCTICHENKIYKTI